MTPRTIRQTVTGAPAVDGAGVRLVRVLGHRTVAAFDPFLLLDAFDSANPNDYLAGFPMHPHRGIETFTYLVHGAIRHQDSLGNGGVIRDGDCQWMTAGGGILHEEMPQASPRLFGLQLWINLPAKHKMTPPRYRGLVNDEVPIHREPGASIRIVAGRYAGRDGAARGEFVDATFLDVTLDPSAAWELATDPGDTLFVYLFDGDGVFAPAASPSVARQAVLFGSGDTLAVKAGARGVRFVAVSGKPLHEPVAWGGPVVMNTEAELEQAWRDLDRGTFVRAV